MKTVGSCEKIDNFQNSCGAFCTGYKIAVNANVAPRAAAISSFVVALVWGLAKNSFIHYVFYNKTYATMYGSLSALIFFFLVDLRLMDYCHLWDETMLFDTWHLPTSTRQSFQQATTPIAIG